MLSSSSRPLSPLNLKEGSGGSSNMVTISSSSKRGALAVTMTSAPLGKDDRVGKAKLTGIGGTCVGP